MTLNPIVKVLKKIKKGCASDIAIELKIPVKTIYRSLNSLVKYGIIGRTEEIINWHKLYIYSYKPKIEEEENGKRRIN